MKVSTTWNFNTHEMLQFLDHQIVTKATIFDFLRNDTPQNNLVQLLKYLAESFDNLGFQKTKKVAVFKTKIVTSSIAMVNLVSLLFIWKEMTWNILNLEIIEFYTCTL